MKILTMVIAVLFISCTVIQYHHHHDDDGICLLIHCDDHSHCTHHHHHESGDEAHSMCCNHTHTGEGNCSLHLSESTFNSQKTFIDHNYTTHIISSMLVVLAQLIPLPLEQHTCLWRYPGNIFLCAEAHASGWSLRAPPCL